MKKNLRAHLRELNVKLNSQVYHLKEDGSLKAISVKRAKTREQRKMKVSTSSQKTVN